MKVGVIVRNGYFILLFPLSKEQFLLYITQLWFAQCFWRSSGKGIRFTQANAYTRRLVGKDLKTQLLSSFRSIRDGSIADTSEVFNNKEKQHDKM